MANDGVVIRRLARELSLRRRHDRLTVRDLVRSEKLQKILLLLAFKIGRSSGEELERLQMTMRIAYGKYLQLTYHQPKILARPQRLDRTIDSFCESDCYIFFRFTKPHLQCLLKLLNFNMEEHAKFDNEERMSGEEIMLRGLYELVSGDTKHKICRTVFGRDASSQSRAFSFFINHMYENFRHLVMGNTRWWYENGFFASSAEAIGVKLQLPNVHNVVSHFIDCNCLETQRVGGGPAESGANAARWDANIQRSFYNGWKSMNGLKHQTVDDAYGFTVDCFGPTSLRRNDLALLRESDINDTFARLQLASNTDYVIFGDSAYKRQSHIRSYFSAQEEDEEGTRMQWNRHVKRLRISIEWNYGHQASLFKILCMHYKLKVLASGNLTTKVFVVTTILRNLHTGYYGSQTSRYFNLDIADDFNYYYVKQLPMQ